MLKNKVKDGDPEIAYYRKNSAASMVSPEDIDKVDFTGVDHIHLTGIGCAVSESCMEAAKKLLKKEKKIIFQSLLIQIYDLPYGKVRKL